jgi:hypothetical protein
VGFRCFDLAAGGAYLLEELVGFGRDGFGRSGWIRERLSTGLGDRGRPCVSASGDGDEPSLVQGPRDDAMGVAGDEDAVGAAVGHP